MNKATKKAEVYEKGLLKAIGDAKKKAVEGKLRWSTGWALPSS